LPQPSAPQEQDTPPRGTPLPSARGWFDELPEEQSGPGDGGDFGPTGEPTHIPYNYKR
jgi:hypothetical protein